MAIGQVQAVGWKGEPRRGGVGDGGHSNASSLAVGADGRRLE
jgi:hypothetical protein